MKTYLKWEERRDNNNNSYWEAEVISTWGVHSYRIRQRISNNKIILYEDSSEKCWIDFKQPRETWICLTDAKYDMERHFISKLKEI
jgi:hypothetical protein